MIGDPEAVTPLLPRESAYNEAHHRIQEVFGLRETPRVAAGRVRVLLHLLAPNMRPQQVTGDLASFWANGYPLIRKELRRGTDYGSCCRMWIWLLPAMNYLPWWTPQIPMSSPSFWVR